MKVYNRLVVHTDRHRIPPDYELKFKDQSNEIPLNASGRRLHIAASVDLPDPNLLRLHAALAGVFHLTNVVYIFRLIAKRSREPGSPPVPSADGDAFMKSIVESEGDQLWQSVAMMWSHCKRTHRRRPQRQRHYLQYSGAQDSILTYHCVYGFLRISLCMLAYITSSMMVASVLPSALSHRH